MQKHVKKEINMQTALQKLTMTLKIKRPFQVLCKR